MILDLFAGPGGWDEGCRIAGYTGELLGIEWDKAACATAEAAGHDRRQADVAAEDPAEFAGRVLGFIASPPCPTFSTAGNGAGKLDLEKVHDRIREFANGRPPAEVEWVDERSRLTAEPMRWIHALRPRWVALEQVPPVLPLWQHTAMFLRGLGYRTWTGVLSAEEYGVPQTRKRAVLIASLEGPVGPPAPTHQAYVSGRDLQEMPDLFGDPLPPPMSMAEALGWDEPRAALRNGAQENAAEREAHQPAGTIYSSRTTNLSWVVRTGNNSMVTGRTGSRRGEGDVQAYERPVDQPAPTLDTNVGGKWQVVLQSNYGNNGDPEDRGERTPDQPAATVTSKIDRAKWVETRPSTTVCGDARIGRPGHKDRDQGEAQFDKDSVRVSVVEAGILQSFPPDYPWQGTSTQRYLQVGNAVPPLLAAAVVRPLIASVAGEVAA